MSSVISVTTSDASCAVPLYLNSNSRDAINFLSSSAVALPSQSNNIQLRSVAVRPPPLTHNRQDIGWCVFSDYNKHTSIVVIR